MWPDDGPRGEVDGREREREREKDKVDIIVV
jgi:hypothetical protein